ncbi:MAG TPA: ABC transporter permease [Candidatus Tidjanibacter gallistercoris]|nr:ABC transporter permease [Candidatus Tidjanibacter gallistercoris]
MPHVDTELFISRRISSRRSGRNNVMVRIATLTVAAGMAVMIIALAVVTGFKKEVTAKLVGFGSHVRIVSLHSNGSLETDPVTVDTALMESVSRLPLFASIAPFAVKGGMIKTPEAIQGVALKGFGPDYDTSFLAEHLLEGTLPETGRAERTKDLLVSADIARLLGLDVDDRVEMLFVSASRPVRRDRFKVCGIYSTGMEELDNSLVFTDIRNVQRLNGWDAEQVTGYEVMTADFGRLDEFAESVYGAVFDHADRTSDVLKVEDIVSLNPNTFDWLRAHNVNALVIIVIMLLVAFLNMVSAMLIILLEKTSMIGVLKALGMRNGAVQKVFLLRSLAIVFRGMFWGNVAGLGLALIQKYTGIIRLDSTGYMLSHVPVNLGWGWWLALNAGVPLVMLFLMIIPARAVSAVKPDRTMRYQ